MKKIDQVLIMAGGRGTRMSLELNLKFCKSLIEYQGQTLIEHLIENLQHAGITNFIIATNDHSHDEIQRLAVKKGLNSESILIADGSKVGKVDYGEVPYELLNKLDERFLMVCGHHPISVEHVVNMCNASEMYVNVITAYKNNPIVTRKTFEKTDRIDRIIYDESFKVTQIREADIDIDYWYARNPYIIHKDVVIAAHNDKQRQTFSKYILDTQKSIGVIKTLIPQEFDYDWEFEEFKKYLDYN